MKAVLVLGLVAALTLPGCAGVIVADATRKESRTAIAKVMTAERPAVDSAEAATCVQKAMSLIETTQLGLDGSHKGVSSENRAKILTYAARPDAVACLDALPMAETAT
jgi:hypothetical protein